MSRKGFRAKFSGSILYLVLFEKLCVYPLRITSENILGAIQLKALLKPCCSSAAVRRVAEPSVLQYMCRAISNSIARNGNWSIHICTILVEVFTLSTSWLLTVSRKWVSGIYIYIIRGFTSKCMFTEELEQWKRECSFKILLLTGWTFSFYYSHQQNPMQPQYEPSPHLCKALKNK